MYTYVILVYDYTLVFSGWNTLSGNDIIFLRKCFSFSRYSIQANVKWWNVIRIAPDKMSFWCETPINQNPFVRILFFKREVVKIWKTRMGCQYIEYIPSANVAFIHKVLTCAFKLRNRSHGEPCKITSYTMNGSSLQKCYSCAILLFFLLLE